MLERFSIEYQSYNGLSDRRAVRQRREIVAFTEFSGKEAPEECDADDFRRYLSHLVERGLNVNTVRFKGNMIRPFFSWAFQVGRLDADTYLAIRMVKNPNGASANGEPKPYSTREMKRFWEELDARWPLVEERWFRYVRSGRSHYKRIATHVMRLQIEAIVALALDCGLRRIEIFSAEIDHIHPDNAFILVPQRGERANGKDHMRKVPPTEHARDAIHQWLEMRAKLRVKHDRPWISAAATQAAGGWLQPMRFERMEELMTTIGDWQLHRFRHTCATNWLRSNMDIEIVQKMLGHATIQQTLRYAKIVHDDVERQVVANETRFRQMTGRRAA